MLFQKAQNQIFRNSDPTNAEYKEMIKELKLFTRLKYELAIEKAY